MGIRYGIPDSPYQKATAMGSASSAASISKIRLMTKQIIR